MKIQMKFSAEIGGNYIATFKKEVFMHSSVSSLLKRLALLTDHQR